MATASPAKARPADWPLYFPIVTTLLLVLSLIAFSDNLVTDIGQPSNFEPRLIVHGIFGLAWSVMLAVQAWLVRMRRIAQHRRYGSKVFLVGAGLIGTTAYLFYVTFKGIAAMDGEVLTNRLLLPVFAVFVWLAWRNRQRPDRHKRYLLMGSFALLSPVLSRDFNRLFWPFYAHPEAAEADFAFLVYYLTSWGALVASLWAYDLATMRRIHPLTLLGSALIAGVVLGIGVFGPEG